MTFPLHSQLLSSVSLDTHKFLNYLWYSFSPFPSIKSTLVNSWVSHNFPKSHQSGSCSNGNFSVLTLLTPQSIRYMTGSLFFRKFSFFSYHDIILSWLLISLSPWLVLLSHFWSSPSSVQHYCFYPIFSFNTLSLSFLICPPRFQLYISNTPISTYLTPVSFLNSKQIPNCPLLSLTTS